MTVQITHKGQHLLRHKSQDVGYTNGSHPTTLTVKAALDALYLAVGGALYWKDPVANKAALPLASNTVNDARVVQDDGGGIPTIYVCIATAGGVDVQWIKVTASVLGDMTKAVYDPTTVNGDAFDMDNMVESGTSKVMTSAERTKLTGIEALADVTDTANVDAAGATMNADTDVKANGWTIDEDDMVSDLDTRVPTQQSVKAYADGKVGRSEWLQNGVVDNSESTLAFNDGTRVFTINRTGASFTYYVQGVLYTVATDGVAGVNTVTLADEEGLWVIYYDGAVLTALKNPSHSQYEDAMMTKCLVGAVYYDATNNVGILQEERHGFQMSPWTHRYLHEVVGLVYTDGLALADFVISDGTDNEDAQFSIAEGECYDEDLEIDLNAINKTTGNIIYYKDGSDWRWATQAGFKCLTFDGTSGTRLAWNNAGTLTEATDNRFVLLHIFATNAYDGDCISIIGQAEYVTLAAASAAAETEVSNLVLGTLPSKEMKPIATIIYQTRDSYGNDVNAKVVQTSGGDDYVDWRTSALSAGVTAGDHGSLGGLTDDDHTQYFLADGTRSITGTYTQNALIKAASSEAVADDAEITIATGVAGWGFAQIGDNEEYAHFTFTTAGVVTLLIWSSNTVNTDTDTKFCIYDAGSGIAIKNRLGSSKTVRYAVHYS